jgi:thiamine monophosphate kinase
MRHIPLSPQIRKAASALGIEPYTLATSGGEDYELLFTAPPNRKVDAVWIGEITETDMTFIDKNGKERAFSPEGYQHWH